MVIQYTGGYWQTGAIFRCAGSVLPRACIVSIFPAILAIGFGYLVSWRREEHKENVVLLSNAGAYTSFTFVVGFLLVFRNQTAYARLWEGTTAMHVLRGQWVGAFGSLIAFTSTSTSSPDDILEFRLKLVRIFSVLHACAIDFIYDMPDGTSPIVGVEGLDDGTLRLLNQADDESLIHVTVQWIQQMILYNINIGVIPTAAPIVSRVFQDLSQGVVTVKNAKKISETPFPFTYCQTLQAVLVLHLIITPIVFVFWVTNPILAGVFTFATVVLFQALNFISAEIENPFGSDYNDISREELQHRFNKTLVTMLSPGASKRPMLRGRNDHEIMELPRLLHQATSYSDAWRTMGRTGRKTFHIAEEDDHDMISLFKDFGESEVTPKRKGGPETKMVEVATEDISEPPQCVKVPSDKEALAKVPPDKEGVDNFVPQASEYETDREGNESLLETQESSSGAKKTKKKKSMKKKKKKRKIDGSAS